MWLCLGNKAIHTERKIHGVNVIEIMATKREARRGNRTHQQRMIHPTAEVHSGNAASDVPGVTANAIVRRTRGEAC